MSGSDSPGLEGLYFGQAAAENEVAANPVRFLATYLDKWNLLDEIDSHRRFLILGPKGTGKSAAAHYVRLSWVERYGEETVFPTFVDFDELNRSQSPLTSLDKKLVGDVTALTDAAWRLFIGVRILDSLLSDSACDLSRDPKVLEFAAELRQAGLASDDFPQVLRRVRDRKGGFSFKFLSGQAGSVQTENLPISQVGDSLLALIQNAKTPNRHILAIDGLDKAIVDNPAYWQTLAALVRVADTLTRKLRSSSGKHVYVMIMCRSDVFRRVRFADAAKISADGAVIMDWGAEAEDPKDVQLWEYIAFKAGVSTDTLFSALPESVTVGGGQVLDTRKYLLQFTRYTPRDLTLLFTELQRVCPAGVLSSEQVRRGADSFASNHLLTEMMSEATGFLPDELIDRFENILSSFPSRIFDRKQFEAALAAVGIEDRATVDKFGEYLFIQGAIGNYRPGAKYVQFYHRRAAGKWRGDGPWVLHTGLIYAFNVPWSPPVAKGSKKKKPESKAKKGGSARSDQRADSQQTATASHGQKERARRRTRRGEAATRPPVEPD